MSSAKSKFIGTHLPFSRSNIKKTADLSKELGATSMAIFLKPKTDYIGPPVTAEVVRDFITNIYPVCAQDKILVHTAYALNLGSDNPESLLKSKNGLKYEIDFADKLGGLRLVLHPGANSDSEKGVKQIADALNEILTKNTRSQILLEIMPGGAIGVKPVGKSKKIKGLGTKIGKTFEELAAIIKRVKLTDKIGVCLDTCHMFLSGYKMGSAAEFEATMRDFDRIVGLKYLKGIHLNDSAYEPPCASDKHAPIGKGFIPMEVFAYIMNSPIFANIPIVTETRLIDTPADAKKELDLLRGL